MTDEVPMSAQFAVPRSRNLPGVDGNSYPDTFADLVADVVAFADPLATEDVADRTWNPDRRRWEVTPHTRGAGLASPAV